MSRNAPQFRVLAEEITSQSRDGNAARAFGFPQWLPHGLCVFSHCIRSLKDIAQAMFFIQG